MLTKNYPLNRISMISNLKPNLVPVPTPEIMEYHAVVRIANDHHIARLTCAYTRWTRIASLYRCDYLSDHLTRISEHWDI